MPTGIYWKSNNTTFVCYSYSIGTVNMGLACQYGNDCPSLMIDEVIVELFIL